MSPQSLLCGWEYKYKYQHVSEEASTESVQNRCRGKLSPKTTAFKAFQMEELWFDSIHVISRKLDCNILF